VSAPGRLSRALAALFMAAGLLLPAAPVTRAADLAFGEPAYTATYNESITFTVPFTATTPVERVEIRMLFPDALGPYISTVEPAGAASGELSHVMDLTGGGHLVPNTTFEVTWAAYPEGGGDPVLSKPLTVRYQDTSHEWKTLEGDLVRVHWYDGSDAFAERALEIGESAIRDTASLLGVTETEPVDFFIYGDDASFRAALGPGVRENVGGTAHSDIRTLFAQIGASGIDDPWVGVVIPHELVHLVFDTAVDNPYRFPPRWFNEGLAVYLSEGYTRGDRQLVEQAADDRTLLPLGALSGQFPTEFQATYLAYAQSASAIDFLVRTYGKDAMLGLVASYADGLTDDEAFTRATGKDLAGFQAAWLDDLGAAEPERYGPVPNKPGPLPPGWGEPAPTPQSHADYTAVLVTGIVVVFGILFVVLFMARRRPEPS
jgi:hypothetical protein